MRQSNLTMQNVFSKTAKSWAKAEDLLYTYLEMQNEPAYLNGHGHVVLPEEQHVTPKVLILVTLKIRKKTICFFIIFLTIRTNFVK